MTAETVRILIAGGFFMALLALRLEADRFGAGEFDERASGRGGPWVGLSWYLMGGALLASLYVVHPQPHDVLLFLIGHRPEVVVYGVVLAALGVLQGLGFATLRYGYLRLPPAQAYPGAAINSVATAVIDEAMFRGAVLGALLAVGLPNVWAILASAFAYVVVTTLAAPGRHPYVVALSLVMGLILGWATIATGGIGAAIIGHTAASFALFICTGHAGKVPLAGREPEELAERQGPPAGWQQAHLPLVPGSGPESGGPGDRIGHSGFVERDERLAAEARRRRGLLARFVGPGPVTHRYREGRRGTRPT